MEERWQDMYPYDDYAVSNEGRVRNKKSGQIVQPWGNRVRIRHNNENIHLYIPKLIDEYFPSYTGVWKVLPEFRSYEINYYGDIRRRRTGRPVTQRISRDGDVYVSLTDAGESYKVPLKDLQSTVIFRFSER